MVAEYSMEVTVPIYLTAVLEYISSEVLSGNAANDLGSTMILPRHIMLVIRWQNGPAGLEPAGQYFSA